MTVALAVDKEPGHSGASCRRGHVQWGEWGRTTTLEGVVASWECWGIFRFPLKVN